MVNWTKFDPASFEFEFDEDKLEAHGLTPDEVAQCFWNAFEVRCNKSFHDRYQIVGRTDAGRALKLIVQVKSRVIRVITGWPI
ncbi:MAG TPA: hypothetical protein VEO02_06665 [Thermoanaerobaculia bacterium]|nr:hypothetical protein [Thermoanaerobaculia bacterium]